MATSGPARVTLICVTCFIAVSAIGCGASAKDAVTGTASSTVAPASLPPADYVTRLNGLCAQLQPTVLRIYGGGGHPAPYPIKVFESEQPALTALYKAFDAQADAMPTTAADQRAVEAFKAYRRLSDAATATMSAAAATGKQNRFDAAFYEVHTMFDNNPALNELHAVGIVCDGR